jgi:hypothetical protein
MSAVVNPAKAEDGSSDMKTLEVLANVPVFYTARVHTVEGDGVTSTDHKIMIRQVKTGTIPKLIKASGSLLLLLTQGKQEEPYDLNYMMLMYPDEALNVLAVLIGKERAFVDELETDDTVALLGLVLEANFDFFVQRLLPKLFGGVKALTTQLQARGINLQNLVGQMQPKP